LATGGNVLRRWTAVLALALGVVLASSALPAGAATADSWSGTYGDRGNTRNNPGEHVITAADAGRLRTTWIATQGTTPYAPPIAGGVAYRVVGIASQEGDRLAATSPRTGATLWTVPLPTTHWYATALAATGHFVVVPYYGWYGDKAGGLLLVDTTTRRIVWDKPMPASTISWSDNSRTGLPYTDGTRIYLSGSSNGVNTYRLGDGKLLWTTPASDDGYTVTHSVTGLAVGNGVVYTTGQDGLVARDATSGRKLWSAAVGGSWPVVAGSRVLVLASGTVEAFAAAGCGHAVCAPVWQRVLAPEVRYGEIGGADARTVFVAFTQDLTTSTKGELVRLSTTTGKIQWSVTSGRYMQGVVRGGGAVWVYDEYITGQGVEEDRILGFSASATGKKPLRTLDLSGTNYEWYPQNLAIGAGTLFEQSNGSGLVGYRVPGT
jgi:hypothetical protein